MKDKMGYEILGLDKAKSKKAKKDALESHLNFITNLSQDTISEVQEMIAELDE